MGFEAGDFKPFLRLVSALLGIGLLVLSCAGFHHLVQTTGSFEGQTSFGCMCFLGVCFGVLLTLGETKWEWFFFLFGFLRYRIGRAIVFAIAGCMIGLIGKNMNDQCNCQSYLLLIIEGIACVAMAGIQLLAILVYGNTSAPVKAASNSKSPKNAVTRPETNTTTTTTRNTPVPAIATSAFQPIVSEPITVPPAAKEEEDPNMPSWMRA